MTTQSRSEPPDGPEDPPIVDVLEQFGDAGWSGSFRSVEDGALECAACESSITAGEFEVEAQHRLEGASDPADMQLVVGGKCSKCGTGGVVVLGYGPNASDVDAAVVSELVLVGARDPIADGGADAASRR